MQQRRSTALEAVMESRARYLETRPHIPRMNRPHLAQELREVKHPHQFDDPKELTRPCKSHARMCAEGHARVKYRHSKKATT